MLSKLEKGKISENMGLAVRFRMEVKKRLDFIVEMIRTKPKILSRYNPPYQGDTSFPLAEITVKATQSDTQPKMI